MKILLSTLLIALLAGCATGPYIDRTYNAVGQSSRVKFIVLHYTVSDKPQSIKILTQQQVSSHYLVTDDEKPVIYGLVPESNQAYHAGVSSWKNFTQLNTSSVGIEIVNRGWVDSANGRVYFPFPQAQIDTVIELVRDIAKRHNVPPENVLGHSDIAPQRKQDPGPLFPWKRFADAGLAVWPDANRVAAVRPIFDVAVPDVPWFQKKLAAYGYAVPQNGFLDPQTRNVISAFQSRYRPANIDGYPDAETASILEVLTSPADAPLPAVIAPAPVAAPATPAAPAAPAAGEPAAPVAPTTPPAPITPAVPETPAVPTTPPPPTDPIKQ